MLMDIERGWETWGFRVFLCCHISSQAAEEEEKKKKNANDTDCVFDLDVDCRGEWHGFFVDQPEALQKGDEIGRERERKWTMI